MSDPSLRVEPLLNNSSPKEAQVVGGYPWPKALLVRRAKNNAWHGDISFAREPTAAELDDLWAFLRTHHEHSSPAVNSHEANEAKIAAAVKALEAVDTLWSRDALEFEEEMNFQSPVGKVWAEVRATLSSLKEGK